MNDTYVLYSVPECEIHKRSKSSRDIKEVKYTLDGEEKIYPGTSWDYCPQCESKLSKSELEKKLISDAEELIIMNNKLASIRGTVKVQKVEIVK